MEQDNQEYKFIVCTQCYTYNHAPYIVDAMNGFTMQQTNFPFVCTIVDDASTDGEQEVIGKYLEENFDMQDKSVVRNEETDDYLLTFARHKTNMNCYFAVLFLKYNHHSIRKLKMPYISEWNDNAKYIAWCEGDDYWLNPRKLQIQIDYLESTPSVSIYVHNAEKIVCATGERLLFNEILEPGIYTIRDVITMKWFTPTASFVYRNNVVISPIWRDRGCNGDMTILYSNLLKGDLYYDSSVMSVYRYGTPSSLSTASNDKVLYQKKMALFKTIDVITNHKYYFYIQKEIIKLRVYNMSTFKYLNSLRLNMRKKICGY